ncbi:unnamed protein product [Phytomonas sp. EM1]|nr:unnamed protein product [Phytomonas sp. EM1]|eukprot:CCW62194.1 unnamed protein product [Phytomonas sp. isolate EM1]
MPKGKALSVTQKRLSVLPLHRRQRLLEPLMPNTTSTLSKTKVRAFDAEGNMTTKQTGTHTFFLKQQTLFYLLRSYPWSWLMVISIALYLALVAWITTLYYSWAWACGVKESTSAITSLYFTVVSLAANGGYMGEAASMGNPSNVCYYGRTVIVMLASFTNIVFVGLVAALFVGKAESTAKFANRIVFSHFCTLARAPRQRNVWHLKFRMANIASQKPLAQGQLRLFCILAEPPTEDRALMDSTLKKGSFKFQGHRVSRREMAPPRAISGDTSKENQGDLPSCTFSSVSETSLSRSSELIKDSARDSKVQEKSHSGSRIRRRGRKDQKQGPAEAANTITGKKADQSPPSPSSQPKEGQNSDDDINSNSEQDSKPYVAVRIHSDSRRETEGGFLGYGGTNKKANREIARPARSSNRSALSDAQEVGNVERTEHPKQTSATMETTPNEEDPLLGQTLLTDQQEHSQVGSKSATKNSRPIKQVKLNVVELRWTCPEEKFLDKGGRQLSLWYPGTICHVIDERSPLYRFMNVPLNSSSLVSSTDVDEYSSHTCSVAWMDVPECFQIVAVFDAIEMESGATIMAKHAYTFTDILRNYKFSGNLTHVHNESAEVHLDYHHFNVVVPLVGDELSSISLDV